MASRERLSCITAVTVCSVLLLICAGVLVWFFSKPFSRDTSFSGTENLRRLIILTKPGKSYPALRLPGLKSKTPRGSLRPEAKAKLKISGTILKELYDDFLNSDTVGYIRAVSSLPVFSQSSLALAEGLGLRINPTNVVGFENFERDLEAQAPSVVHHLDALPKCIQRTAESLPFYPTYYDSSYTTEYSYDVYRPSFLSYLIAEDIDSMPDEEIYSLRIDCSAEFLLKERPLVSDKLFMQLSMPLSATALDLVQSFRSEIVWQLLQKSDPETHVVSIYGFPEYHLQSMFECLEFLNMPEQRIEDHVVLEIYDKMIRIRIGRVWQNWDIIDLLRALTTTSCHSWLLSAH